MVQSGSLSEDASESKIRRFYHVPIAASHNFKRDIRLKILFLFFLFQNFVWNVVKGGGDTRRLTPAE